MKASFSERLNAWLDERTGLRDALRRALDTALPGGPRWRYVFGSVLLALVGVEVITGLAMLTVYAPGAQTAWASTFYLQHVLPWGGIVRAMHHWASHALVVTIGAHTLQVLVAGGHRRPREVNWWIGLALAGLILGFAITGFPLAWDQRGYWVSRVETGIMGSVPVLGPYIQRFLQGGNQYGTLTLTRFFTLHTFVLPALMALLVGLHLALFRKHGVTPPANATDTPPDENTSRWWPSQAVRDSLAALVAVGLVVGLARARGVWLDAPADAQSNYPARPEWFFMPLSQLLKYFHGPLQFVGTMVIPGVLTGYLVALPWIDGPKRKGAGRVAAFAPLAFAVVAATFLGASLVRGDQHDREFQKSMRQSQARAHRAIELARGGIPPEGPLEMLRNDPRVRPRELFAQHCGVCHAVRGVSEQHKGPRLDGFGSRRWAEAFIMWPDAPELMGTTEMTDPMPSMLRRIHEDGVRATAEWLYSRGVERGDRAPDPALVAEGDRIYHERCTRCHLGEGDRSETDPGARDAPDLDTWGSRDWVRMQILHPHIREMYGARNKMPRFQNKLNERELDMILDYVRTLRSREAPAPVAPPEEGSEAPAAGLTPAPSDGNGSGSTPEAAHASENTGSSTDVALAGDGASGAGERPARGRRHRR